MSRYRLTPLAKDGLRRSLLYVRDRFGREAAIRVRNAYAAAFQRVADKPSLGHRRKDLAGNLDVRFWPVGPGLFAYRQVGDMIEILAIERSGRDWPDIVNDFEP